MPHSSSVWDRVARQYQETLNARESNYPERLMAFLEQRGALAPGGCVADIGCGAGKYAVRFAARGCRVLALDISEEMVRYTRENLAGAAAPCAVRVCDFAALDLDREGWTGCAQLTFAAMTPAVETPADVRRMCRLSARHCFVSKFSRMENPLQEAVCRALGQPARPFAGGARQLAGWVEQLGYAPRLFEQPYSWENALAPEAMVQRFFEGPSAAPDTPENRARARAAMAPFLEDGLVRERVAAAAHWLYWTV